MTKTIAASSVLLGILCIAIFSSLCISTPSKNITELSSVEIREYQGEDLSSIADFRENSIRGPQYINITEYRLIVTGDVDRTLELSYDELRSNYPHYQKHVTLYCVEGWDVTILWEGILVSDLLDEAGVKPGADTIIFRAHDGYSTSLPMDYIRDRKIILAYAANNVTLPAERGYPFELVAEDRWGYKWIKWVEEIEVSDEAGYRGYWESRGYSQGGDVNKSFFSI
ncbi:MAG TPA: molybdopterin-dependent oxidoreductase [Methanoregulaceae archaeon]|nr:molybdopterin-dependent oxidoreductase [Methanoregulaceae archaeon]